MCFITLHSKVWNSSLSHSRPEFQTLKSGMWSSKQTHTIPATAGKSIRATPIQHLNA